MSHLVTLRSAAPTAEAAHDLARIVDEMNTSIHTHLADPTRRSSPLRLKRDRVQLSVADSGIFHIGRRAERLGELINILATMARTRDALTHLADTDGGTLVACNPTTGDDGHDIEINTGTDHIIVEVSDVAGHGNANGKMTKDLTTLLTAPPNARTLLAVSLTSASWLTNPRVRTADNLGVTCTEVARIGQDEPTVIVEVARQRPSDAVTDTKEAS